MRYLRFAVRGLIPLAALLLVALSGDGGPAEAVPGVTDPVPQLIDNVSIDMDPYGTPANPANGLLGSIETCKAVPIGGSSDIDLIVDEIDPSDRLKGLNPTLYYAGAGPGAVNVVAVDDNLMIGANPGSDVLPLSDHTPDNGNGRFMIGATDLGPVPDSAESGEGVQARVTLTGVGPVGMSWLTQSPFFIAATGPLGGAMIPVNAANGAVVAVGDVNGDTAVDDLDCDIPDLDDDGIGDPVDNCFWISNPWQQNADGDPYGDACDNCPDVPTPWSVPEGDSDCDGFADDAEAFVGTDPADACPDTPDPDDEADDKWAADFNDDQTVDILDIVQLTPPVYGSVVGDPLYSVRKDLDPNGKIHILDIVKLTPPMFNTSCTP